MKRILFITLLFIICASNNISAQVGHLEIEVEAVETPDGSITVTIQGDYPAYTIMLYDKEPWKGAAPIETLKDINESTHTFTNLKIGTYHVCVLDAKENMDCKKVKLARR